MARRPGSRRRRCAIPLPLAIDGPGAGRLTSNGFEGVAVSPDGRYVLAAIQRAFAGEPKIGGVSHTLIARYDLVSGAWDFFLYPLDVPTVGNPGLSEITALADGTYLVIERDGEVGAAVEQKKVYRFSLGG